MNIKFDLKTKLQQKNIKYIDTEKLGLPSDFNPKNYQLLNSDLSHMTTDELITHYLTYGKQEGRSYNSELPLDFNPIQYKILNNDLDYMTTDELIKHYLTYGKHEGRRYNDIPLNFNPVIYKLLNLDLFHLTNEELRHHYLTYGCNEGRKYIFPKISQSNEYIKSTFENPTIEELNNELLHMDLLNEDGTDINPKLLEIY